MYINELNERTPNNNKLGNGGLPVTREYLKSICNPYVEGKLRLHITNRYDLGRLNKKSEHSYEREYLATSSSKLLEYSCYYNK